MTALYFLGENQKPEALDHKFSRSHKHDATVLKANAHSGSNEE